MYDRLLGPNILKVSEPLGSLESVCRLFFSQKVPVGHLFFVFEEYSGFI